MTQAGTVCDFFYIQSLICVVSVRCFRRYRCVRFQLKEKMGRKPNKSPKSKSLMHTTIWQEIAITLVKEGLTVNNNYFIKRRYRYSVSLDYIPPLAFRDPEICRGKVFSFETVPLLLFISG